METVYETMVIIDAMIPDEAIESEFDAIKKQIEQKGNLIRFDKWGRRKIAFKINGRSHAEYGVFYYNAPTSFPNELSRQFRINENILRWVTIKDNPVGIPAPDKRAVEAGEDQNSDSIIGGVEQGIHAAMEEK